MERIKKVKIDEIVSSRDLLIDEEFITNEYYKEFNEAYSEFCDLNDRDNLNEEEVLLKISSGKKAATLIALNFNFNDETIKAKSNDYIKFAREILYVAGSKPFHDSEAHIYLIRALYGQTNIAYSHLNEHKIINVEDGNEWVDHLERNTQDRTLKSYALTLRTFQFMVNGQDLGMSVQDILNKAERELIYASKWDEENFLAFYALGLLYSDRGNSKFNVEKAIENFNKVLEFKNKDTNLDKYLMNTEKERSMINATKKIEALKQN